jgi:hypothetical protein
MSIRCEQGAGEREVTRPSGWRLVMGLMSSTVKTLTVLKPWQQIGHGSRMGQSAVVE